MKRLAVLFFFSLLLLGCTQGPAQPSPSLAPTTSPTIQPAATTLSTPTPSPIPIDTRKTFVNPYEGFSFRYDDSWELVKDEENISLAHLQRPPYEDLRVLGPIPTEEDIQTGALQYYAELSNSLNLTLLSKKPLSVGTLNAYRLTAKTVTDGTELNILLVGIQSKKKPIKNYFFYIGATSKTFQKNGQEYDAMIESFKQD